MMKIMKTYFDTWKFKHPCGQDFINVVNDVVGENMDWFFDQALYGTDLCDYTVASISNREVKTQIGYLDNFEDCNVNQETTDKYKSKVVVHRLEGMKLPVEVRVYFEDGTSELKTWDGRDRGYTFDFDTNQKIIKAVVDPAGKLPIDKNWINNVYVVEPDPAGVNY